MATKTETKTDVAVIVNSNAKVVTLIIAVVEATIGAISRKRQLAEGIRSEADREGYDRKQASQMVAASYQTAFKLDEPQFKGQTPAELEAAQKAFALKSRPDVSKVLALAYPEKSAELKKAYAHNDKLKNAPKQDRIGENNLLRIARGEITCAEALATKQANKEKTSSKLDSVSTPAERWANSVKGIILMHHIGQKGKLTKDEAMSAIQAQFDLIK